MHVYYPTADHNYLEGKIESIVPGPQGHPNNIEVSAIHNWYNTDNPPIFHFSANELIRLE